MCRKHNYLLFILLMLGLTGSLAAQSPGTENLRHLWTFEEGTNDQIGLADGEFVGDNITVEDGDLVTIPNADNVADSWLELPGWAIDIADSYDELSVVAWFTPDTANDQWNTTSQDGH
jgi:hypothetical protein